MVSPQNSDDEIAPARWLEHLTNHLGVARNGEDHEGVHQLRVAAARLEVFLRLAGRRCLRDDLRWLRERASAVRDLDVLGASGVPAPLAAWLADERTVARAGLVEALESSRLRALLEGWRWVPALRRVDAVERREQIARRTTKRARRTFDASASLEAFHDVRRSLRRLRYADEWLGRDVGELKALQETLGLLNDVAVAYRLASECPHSAELSDYLGGLTRELDRRAARARIELRRRFEREP
ncbi:MAG: CHAD domain-containing protein [Planctomycetes bacterium]|nr:CHAD domain-containing protein [Planctomycetota bacterium]